MNITVDWKMPNGEAMLHAVCDNTTALWSILCKRYIEYH